MGPLALWRGYSRYREDGYATSCQPKAWARLMGAQVCHMRVEPHDAFVFVHLHARCWSLVETEHSRHQIVKATAMIAHLRLHLITARD